MLGVSSSGHYAWSKRSPSRRQGRGGADRAHWRDPCGFEGHLWGAPHTCRVAGHWQGCRQETGRPSDGSYVGPGKGAWLSGPNPSPRTPKPSGPILFFKRIAIQLDPCGPNDAGCGRQAKAGHLCNSRSKRCNAGFHGKSP